MKRFVLLALFCGACDFRTITATPSASDDVPPDTMMMSTGETGPGGNSDPVTLPLALTALTATQVRQGAGSVTLALIGSGFSRITTATLGSLPATFSASDDTHATLSTNVPHGASIQTHPLALTAGAETATFVDAINVTAICAAPSGSDTAAGTTQFPFQTLDHALAAAAAGDTVSLGAGTFNAPGVTLTNAGFGTTSGTANVPNEVALIGAGRAITIIKGPDTGTTAGLILSGTNVVAALQVRDYRHGIVVMEGTVTLTDTQLDSNTGAGLYVAGGTVSANFFSKANTHGVYLAGMGNTTLSDSDIGPNTAGGFTCGTGSAGIVITESASLAVAGGSIHNNASGGVRMASDGTLELANVQITGNAPISDTCSSQVDVLAGTTTLRGAEISNGGTFGIAAHGNAVLRLREDTLVETPRRVALGIDGTASVSMRDSTLSLGPGPETNHVVEIGGTPHLLDFGILGGAGGNDVFFDPVSRGGAGPHAAIYDTRDLSNCSLAQASWRGSTVRMCYKLASGVSPCATVHTLTGSLLDNTVNHDVIACADGPSGSTGPTGRPFCFGDAYALDVGPDPATTGCSHIFD